MNIFTHSSVGSDSPIRTLAGLRVHELPDRHPELIQLRPRLSSDVSMDQITLYISNLSDQDAMILESGGSNFMVLPYSSRAYAVGDYAYTRNDGTVCVCIQAHEGHPSRSPSRGGRYWRQVSAGDFAVIAGSRIHEEAARAEPAQSTPHSLQQPYIKEPFDIGTGEGREYRIVKTGDFVQRGEPFRLFAAGEVRIVTNAGIFDEDKDTSVAVRSIPEWIPGTIVGSNSLFRYNGTIYLNNNKATSSSGHPLHLFTYSPVCKVFNLDTLEEQQPTPELFVDLDEVFRDASVQSTELIHHGLFKAGQYLFIGFAVVTVENAGQQRGMRRLTVTREEYVDILREHLRDYLSDKFLVMAKIGSDFPTDGAALRNHVRVSTDRNWVLCANKNVSAATVALGEDWVARSRYIDPATLIPQVNTMSVSQFFDENKVQKVVSLQELRESISLSALQTIRKAVERFLPRTNSLVPDLGSAINGLI